MTAHSFLSHNRVMQPSVGVFNETAMNRLDLVISEASKYNIRLILVRSL